MSLINPADVDTIAKLIMKYQLMKQAGTVALDYVMPEKEADRLQKELLRLSITRQRRDLGMDDYDAMVNDGGKDKLMTILGFEAKRRTPPLTSSHELVGQRKSLIPTFKWATLVDNGPVVKSISKEASHGRNAILRAIGTRF